MDKESVYLMMKNSALLKLKKTDKTKNMMYALSFVCALCLIYFALSGDYVLMIMLSAIFTLVCVAFATEIIPTLMGRAFARGRQGQKYIGVDIHWEFSQDGIKSSQNNNERKLAWSDIKALEKCRDGYFLVPYMSYVVENDLRSQKAWLPFIGFESKEKIGNFDHLTKTVLGDDKIHHYD